jgi:hypothetical protein
METSKIYVDYKPCDKPLLFCKFHKNGPYNNLSEYGLTYFEDDIGYYFNSGELICDAE